ncbi:unnamed protein product [Caenorhabditis bovis]|uniref:Uncharacterized protein n=1 Tax=Caenorhabditis bovis TaxID=2654633 RepID=A0A8S1ELD1_9PELO|nr:unnamed protein product [Caenorhabditis bovis]
MGRKRKFVQDGESGATNDYAMKLKISNNTEPHIRQIVRSIMHTMGDSLNPLPENEDQVIDILKNELIGLLNDSVEINKESKKASIELADMIFVLQNQKGLISRFIAYLIKRSEALKFTKSKMLSSTCGANSDVDDSDDDLENEEIEGIAVSADDLKRKGKKEKSPPPEDSLYIETKHAFEVIHFDFEQFANFNDELEKSRQNALLKFIAEIDSNDYSKFAEARRVSFQKTSTTVVMPNPSARKRISESNLQLLLKWIGRPPLKGECEEVFVAYFAKEVILEIVSNALLQKFSEPEGLFKNDLRTDMPKQEFNNWDLWGCAICFGIFMAFVLIATCTCINYCFIREQDELTKMEMFGYRHNIRRIRLGPHSRKTIARKMLEKEMEDADK